MPNFAEKTGSFIFSTLTDRFSLGSLVVVALAGLSSIFVAISPVDKRPDLEMWLFARPHEQAYQPLVKQWNQAEKENVQLFVMGIAAMERRMLSGFLSGTPVADLVEADVNVASRAFAGPLEDIGFLDLTERIQEEGILAEMNEPSFSPWTSRGRVFGLPHDVHPVLLCYRSDVVEQAGIDVTKIETWDDFIRELKPLMADNDSDGNPDRYLLNVWEQQLDVIEALVLQAGGTYFDENNHPTFATDINVHVISTITSWITNGPNRIAVDAEEFSESGNRLKVQGKVIASLMPDWLSGVWLSDMPQLSGKVKLMPLPAWQPGGRRTSVWGGSMLGISRRSARTETAWEIAKQLYLSEKAAKRLYQTNGIISPLKRLWSQSFYDEPNSYFCGQSVGRLYIEQAPSIPRRTSSPHNKFAKECVRNVIGSLKQYAMRKKLYEPEQLYEEARRQLSKAQKAIEQRIRRNVFMKESA